MTFICAAWSDLIANAVLVTRLFCASTKMSRIAVERGFEPGSVQPGMVYADQSEEIVVDFAGRRPPVSASRRPLRYFL